MAASGVALNQLPVLWATGIAPGKGALKLLSSCWEDWNTERSKWLPDEDSNLEPSG